MDLNYFLFGLMVLLKLHKIFSWFQRQNSEQGASPVDSPLSSSPRQVIVFISLSILLLFLFKNRSKTSLLPPLPLCKHKLPLEVLGEIFRPPEDFSSACLLPPVPFIVSRLKCDSQCRILFAGVSLLEFLEVGCGEGGREAYVIL